MKISKHIHSCLLIEENNKTVLIDPGKYTYREKALDLKKLKKLDMVLITHEHGDHICIPLLKEIISESPKAEIISNNSVKNLLKKEGFSVSVEKNEYVTFQNVAHAWKFDGTSPENTIFTVFNRLLHPGDSADFEKVPEVLALPIHGMWQYPSKTVEHVAKMRPKYVIPIHDYLLKDEFRKNTYKRLEVYFGNYTITFIPLETGEIIDI